MTLDPVPKDYAVPTYTDEDEDMLICQNVVDKNTSKFGVQLKYHISSIINFCEKEQIYYMN